MIRCKKCHKLKKESSFYPSSLKQNSFYCKDCQNEWMKKALKKYRDKLKHLKIEKPTEDFNDLMGGYRITILNHTTRKGEPRFSCYNTATGSFYSTEDMVAFEVYLFSILKEIKVNGQKED